MSVTRKKAVSLQKTLIKCIQDVVFLAGILEAHLQSYFGRPTFPSLASPNRTSVLHSIRYESRQQ